MTAPLLTARELVVGYDGHAVTEPFHFTVHAGDYLCVVGENGSGKTTLLRTLLRLQEPIAGEVVPGELKRNEIGYLPQQTALQRDFPARVREIVRSGCQGRLGLRPFYRREERELAENAMERMGISALAGRCFRELSGGQRQRVLLARALCAARKLLFLDEPVTGLDPGAAAGMYALIGELNREGLAVVMISHDPAAVDFASHILRIGGRSFFGTRDEYLQSDVSFGGGEVMSDGS